MGHNAFQVLDVVFAVERAHLVDTGSVWLVNVQFFVQPVAKHQLVGHFHPEWLHGVAWPVVNAAH